MKHEIAIQSNPSLRYGTVSHVRKTTGSKTYVACIVATATEKAVEFRNQQAEGTKKCHRENNEKLAAVADALGILPSAADAAYLKEKAAWDAAMKVEWAKLPAGTTYSQIPAQNVAAMGIPHPERGDNSPMALKGLERNRVFYEKAIADHKNHPLKVGDQMVVTWIGRTDLIDTAMIGAAYLRDKGYTLEVRTDIIVTPK